jgi:hypothetical protein
MSNDVPGWVDDGSLGWAPEPLAALPSPQPAEAAHSGPWSSRQKIIIRKIVIPGFWPWRIGIGLAQGLLFFALFYTRALRLWPGDDPFLFSALTLAGLFVPLLLIEGLGLIAARRLLPFAGIAAGLLALLGWYHHWRVEGAAVMHAGLWLIGLCATALFIAQAVLHARERADSWRITYPDLFAASWQLAARLLVWAMLMAAGLVLISSPLTPRLHLEDGDPVSLLALGLVSALAFQLTAALPRFMTAMKDALVASATIALPLVVGAALLLISTALANGAAPLPILLAAMAALTIAISASHRGGEREDRRAWRDGFEVFGAVLLLILAGMAAWSLDVRVSAFGWTAGRVFAACGVALFAAYGAGYSAVAIAWLVRGHSMHRLQSVNLVLAALLFLGCAALASPLADPLRLSVQSQARALEQGYVAVEAFDFANLERDGARFGRDALAGLSRSLYPDIARAAASVRGAVADHLNPTEIGANIAVRSQGAVLPATLLARDWSQVLGVPACLNTAAEICDAYFLDLNGDERSEILLVSGSETRWWAAVMQADEAGRWSLAGRLASGCGASLSDLRKGRFSALPALPGWGDVSVGGKRLTVTPSYAGCSGY